MIQNFIANQLGLPSTAISGTLELLQSGASVPFIARYRKEKTQNLPEEILFKIKENIELFNKIQNRKTFIIDTLTEQKKLPPELKAKLHQSWDINEIEDLYLPFKKKRKTKAEDARSKGLEPLARAIMAQNISNLTKYASQFINREIPKAQEAINGALHIIAEWIAEDQRTREILRNSLRSYGKFYSKVVSSKKEEADTYRNYWSFEEKGSKSPSHRILAILRGTKEGYLRSGITFDSDRFIQNLQRRKIKPNSTTGHFIKQAVEDAYKRLLYPSVENQVISEWQEKAEETAMEVFAKNLRQLLLSPPLGNVPVLALDPGFKTGCKLVCLDAQGTLLHETKIFPHPPQRKLLESEKTLKYLCNKFNIKHIAIGNGTAGRETYEWINQFEDSDWMETHLISEDGASIYSASEVARKEFPDQDITVRGAASIGRRLLDPLSELVKINPQSLGIGQYQHDVNQNKLQGTLDNTVVSCVNKVGVDVNKASVYLLQYIAGLGPKLAENIIEFRKNQGKIENRNQIKKVERMGQKTYEQCIGFLRIKDGDNPLDNTGIHPESYPTVEEIAKKLKVTTQELVNNHSIIDQINPTDFDYKNIGSYTLQDIIKELRKPGHDPRGKAETIRFDSRIKSIQDLEVGMTVIGVISNMTNFGAFVNIGIKQDALLHISQISNRFIKDPAEVLSLGQKIQGKIIEIDLHRSRVNLSIK